MMKAFRYDDDLFDPPAPVLEVEISHLQRSLSESSRQALLDTGADMTAIPVAMAERLQLTRVGKMYIEDVNGNTVITQTYAAKLHLADKDIAWLEVVLTELEFVVLGRDVLNLLDIRLNGPGLMLAVID